MRIRLMTCALALLLCAAHAEAQFDVPSQTPAEQYHLEFGFVWWTPAPDIVLNTDALRSIATDIDFVREFGVESKRFRELRGTLKGGRKHKLRFQYVPIAYEASAQLQRQVNFGGRVFTVGLPASASIDWKLWRAGYEWDIVSRSAGFLGVLAELKYNDVKAQISSQATGVQAYEAKAPVPALGVIGRGYLSEYFSITGELSGFKMPGSISEKFDAEFWDFDIYGTLNLGRNLGVQGGYRSIDANYIVDEDAGRLKMKGLYFGGVVRF